MRYRVNTFEPSGYLDIKGILSCGMPFIFIVGGRGIGKTYGALKYVLENDVFFMFMRRTQSQADLISKPDFSPFTPLNNDLHMDVRPVSVSKYNAAMVDFVEDAKTDKIRGYTCALSTISNLRGFDASRVELLIYDEFIPERHERPIKEEGQAFFNAYETMNRNRELKGLKPMQVLALANSNDLGNPIFMELGVVNKVVQMKKRNQLYMIDNRRGLAIFLLDETEIGSRKRDTALYRLTDPESEFMRMAVSNEFIEEDSAIIRSRPLIEYRPIVTVGEVTIYKHKDRREYYAANIRQGNPPIYTSGDADIKRYKKRFYYLWEAYLKNKIIFSDKLTLLLFEMYNNK